MRPLTYFIFFSLLVHLTSYTGFELFAPSLPPNPLTTVTEFELVEDADLNKFNSDEKPVIKQLDSPNSMFAAEDARFSSEKTQRVQIETRVAQIGPTQNKSALTKNNSEKMTKPIPRAEDGILPEFTRSLNSAPNTNTQSSLGNELPRDIQLSDTTNLNTDSNIYYSFYDRVEQLFRIRWSDRVHYYWDRIPVDFKKENLAGRVWSTTFEVVLKGSGEYHSATIIRSSGYKPFDEAAIYSFKSARYFPNVPKAKVEHDGFVRLKYRFNLHVDPYL